MSNTPNIRFKRFTDSWEQHKLGDLMNVASVKRIHQSDWTDAGIRFLRARDIVAAAKGVEPSDYLYISKEKYDEYSALSGKVAIDDLLVTGVGTIGIPYLISNSEPLYFKDGNIIWFQNNGKINGRFFYYSFIDGQIQSFIQDSAGIGTVGTYTIESGKKTPILLPKDEEQEQIGAFFSVLDNFITLHQRRCDETKEMKKYMLQKVFPQNGKKIPEIRFAGFAGDWEQCKVGDIVGRTYSGGTPKTSVEEYWDGEIPWVQSSNLSEHELFNVDIQRHITELGLQKSAAQLVPKNSIAVVSHVGVGKLVFMPCDYTTSQDFISLSELKTEPIFSCYALYKRLQDDLHIVQGSAIKGITKEDLLGKVITVPSEPEQRKIGVTMQNLDNLITLHQHKYDELKSVKKFMLQNMFPQKG